MTTTPILGKPVHDIAQVKLRTKAITAGSTPVLAAYGSARMVDSKIIVLYNNSTVTVEYGFESTLTYGQGLILPPGVQIELAVGERIPVYVVTSGFAADVRIAEGY